MFSLGLFGRSMSTAKHIAPDRSLSAFNCPFCHAFAAMTWGVTYEGPYYNVPSNKASPTPVKHDAVLKPGTNTQLCAGLEYARCTHCKLATVWFNGKLVHPAVVEFGPAPAADLPADIKKDFVEARVIGGQSPRGAAALLRLCVQKLCKHLGEDDGNLNNAIGNLVRKGLDAGVAQALDTVRVIGNEAVHPGTMDLRDDVQIAERLFELVNYITDAMITQPARREALFGQIPPGSRAGIDRRDGKK
jgi:hypothetical protein